MAEKKNYYAVRKGRKTGIYKTWKECQAQVTGFSGAEFKGFVTLKEAENFLGAGAAKTKPKHTGELVDVDLIAYTDGSYEHRKKAYAYGVVILTPELEEVHLSGRGMDEGATALRNVAGEMQGAMEAVTWALDHGYGSLEIHYDYEGIEKWVNKAWAAKNPYTQAYAAFMEKAMEKLDITFRKVRAHTGVHFNEVADQLAKAALEG